MVVFSMQICDDSNLSHFVVQSKWEQCHIAPNSHVINSLSWRNHVLTTPKRKQATLRVIVFFIYFIRDNNDT